MEKKEEVEVEDGKSVELWREWENKEGKRRKWEEEGRARYEEAGSGGEGEVNGKDKGSGNESGKWGERVQPEDVKYQRMEKLVEQDVKEKVEEEQEMEKVVVYREGMEEEMQEIKRGGEGELEADFKLLAPAG